MRSRAGTVSPTSSVERSIRPIALNRKNALSPAPMAGLKAHDPPGSSSERSTRVLFGLEWYGPIFHGRVWVHSKLPASSRNGTMASFYNLETNEPITTMYIGSSRNGNIVLRHPTGMSMRAPKVIVANGAGVATPVAMAGKTLSRWSFSELSVVQTSWRSTGATTSWRRSPSRASPMPNPLSRSANA
jgi:hypothetical protein